jgi:SAM-dependent methyltransferase
MQATLKRLVPPPVRRVLRNGQGAFLDLIDAARGIDLPPHRLRGGYGDLKAVGHAYLRYFIEYAKLRPNHKVLDVGCGIGRMALPLTRYLSAEGEYYGFDPGPDGVNWCIGHVTPRFHNFHFEVADLRNEFFNPLGKLNAEDYRFPYEGKSSI